MVKDWFPLAIVLYTKPYMREISWSREWWSAFRISTDDPNLNHPAFSMLHVPSILADNPTHFLHHVYCYGYFPQSAKRCAWLVMWAYRCMYTIVCGLHTSEDIWELIQPFFFLLFLVHSYLAKWNKETHISLQLDFATEPEHSSQDNK